MLALGHSEGVGSYGDPRGEGDPWDKGDKKAAAVLANNENRRKLANLLYAATGLQDQHGRKSYDEAETVALVRSVIETSGSITKYEIGAAFTGYGPKTKQLPAAGVGWLVAHYRRLAQHLGLLKTKEWKPRSSWRVVDITRLHGEIACDNLSGNYLLTDP